MKERIPRTYRLKQSTIKRIDELKDALTIEFGLDRVNQKMTATDVIEYAIKLCDEVHIKKTHKN